MDQTAPGVRLLGLVSDLHFPWCPVDGDDVFKNAASFIF